MANDILVGPGEKLLRPIPDIEMDERDEALIAMAMTGAFLSSYNVVRSGIDLGDGIRDAILGTEDIRESGRRLFKFFSTPISEQIIDKIRGE